MFCKIFEITSTPRNEKFFNVFQLQLAASVVFKLRSQSFRVLTIDDIFIMFQIELSFDFSPLLWGMNFNWQHVRWDR
jgi:hypothetical protein